MNGHKQESRRSLNCSALWGARRNAVALLVVMKEGANNGHQSAGLVALSQGSDGFSNQEKGFDGRD